MTINVSLRVPDGIVVASDSLATSLMPIHANVQIEPPACEKCGHQGKGGAVKLPPMAVPGSSTPLASKLFYISNYGVSFFGNSSVNGRTLFNHVMVFRTTVFEPSMSLESAAQELANQLHSAANADPNIKGLQKGALICGFQISGYDKDDVDNGRTIVVSIKAGMPAQIDDPLTEFGVTVSGEQSVVQLLFSAKSGPGAAKPSFNKMTIPDAIDYARFLVQTTSDYHRFADMVPTVGGPTEIALITKWIGFRWIQRKKILGDETTRLNIGKISHEISQLRRDLTETDPAADFDLEPQTVETQQPDDN